MFHLQGQTALPGNNMTTSRSFNLWFGSSIPSCSGVTGEICGQDPQFTNYSGNDFSLQSTSPAKDTGTNLGAGPAGQSFDFGISPNASWPNPAKAQRIGAWDRGAYEFGGTPASLPGDLNNDGTVNSLDWSIMNARWGTSDAGADLNHDGIVNSLDFSILNQNWGRTQ